MNWNYVDKILNQYLLTYKRKQNDLKDSIQSIFDMGFNYKELTRYLKNNDLSRFKRYLQKNEQYMSESNYALYMAKKYINKSKITYKEMLEVILLVEYAKFQYELADDRFDTFYNISEEVVNEEIEKVESMGYKRKHLKWTPFILTSLLLTPNNLGNTWQEYVAGIVIYNAEEVYKQALIDLRQDKPLNVNRNEYREIFKRQQKREINKKLQDKNDKFMGQIDNEDNYLINQEKLYVYNYYGVKKVRFVAVIDDRTTDVCKSRNGKVYDIEKLTLGENLPPLHYNCRSYIEPVREGQK